MLYQIGDILNRKKWIVSESNRDIAAEIAENCGVDPFAAYLLVARGLTDEFLVEGTYRLVKRTTDIEVICTGLKADKTYTFKVRAYNVVDGVKVYTNYSEVLTYIAQ